MAIPATAGTETLSTTEAIIYVDSNGCSEFMVRCVDATNPVLVNVPGLHDSGDFYEIEIGQEVKFRLNHLGIRKVTAKAKAGTSEIDFGVVSKTFSEG